MAKYLFLNENIEIDPNIEVIGNYTKTSEPIECRCKKCGATWNPTANNLILIEMGVL